MDRVIAVCIAVAIVAVAAAISIGCTISSNHVTHKDQVVKLAAARHGCNYTHGELLCPADERN